MCLSARAAGNEPLKPYVVLILDTSGSMDSATGSGPPSCGGVDSRLDHARCAINKIVNSYGDIMFALGRFRQVMGGTTTAGTFPAGCCTAGPDVGANGACGAGITCSALDDNFELLTALVDGGNATTARWVDFSGDTCTATGSNPEIWNADSNTPLEGTLNGAKRYWSAQQDTNFTLWPATSPGFNPIGTDPTDTSFLPTGCNPNPTTCVTHNGTGDSFTKVGSVMTLTDAAGLFVAADVGRSLSIAGAANTANNGTFTITSRISATQITYVNASGVAQAYAGNWTITSCCASQCRPYITIFMTDGAETCGGNPAGAGVGADALLRTDVNKSGVGDAFTLAGTTITLTDAGAAFTAADVGQSITVAGSTTAGNNGTFLVTAVPSATSVQYTNAAGVAETFPGTWVFASAAYTRRYRVLTKPIGFGIAPGNAQIEAIAHSGGAPDDPTLNEGYYAADEAGLELAISSILADAIKTESCNNLDDDCDTIIDEGFTLGANCNNGKLGKCLVTGSTACRVDGTGTQCNAGVAACATGSNGSACTVQNAAGATVAGTCQLTAGLLTCQPTALVDTSPGVHDAENKVAGNKCNNIDDDCDGIVDEGVTGCTCIVNPEICNGVDDNCNGTVDENTAIACSVGVCGGTRACAATPGCDPSPACIPGQPAGNNCCLAACSAVATTETCNGLDDDCDGNRDGFTQACSNLAGSFPALDPRNNPGGDHAPDSACETLNAAQPGKCVCHPGTRTCPLNVGPPNAFGACTGEGLPGIEICNGLDDDCDGLIDEAPPTTCTTNAQCPAMTPTCDNPTGMANMGTCQPADCSLSGCGGQLICMNGVPTCTANGSTTDPTCNGIDDDCDGSVDEEWQCADPDGPDNILGNADDCPCTAAGQCNAHESCQNGGVVCQGSPVSQETCNCQDDNCNGQVDEGALCGGGSECVNCQCAFHCSPGEFPCPIGKKCKGTMPNDFCVADPCYQVTCPTDPNGDKKVCIEDPAQANNHLCVTACSQTSCGANQVCIGSTGECKPDDCRTFPDRCATNQSCVVDPGANTATCVTNPCFGVTCGTDQYCVAGQCYGSCADIDCPTGQRCRLGTCEPDPCGHPCPFGQACQNDTGMCVNDPCAFQQCQQGQYCNPNNGGQCEPDPCVGTTCPHAGEVCRGGSCYDPADFLPDAGMETHVTTGGGGGCSTSGGGAGLLVGLALLFTRRRRAQGGAA